MNYQLTINIFDIMAEFTAGDVGKLREMTGAGLMDCKKALTEAKGSIEAAVDLSAQEGPALPPPRNPAAKPGKASLPRTSRPGPGPASWWRSTARPISSPATIPSAPSRDEISRKLAAGAGLADLEADRIAAVARIGENIQVPRFIRYEVSGNGMIAAYIHTGAKVGVLVEVGAGKEATVAHDDFKQLVRDITLQIAAGNPLVVSREQLPAAVVAKEREIAAEQVKNKPPQAIAKIVEGKLEKYFQTLLSGGPGFCQAQLGDFRQGAPRRHCQAVGR